MSCEHLRELKEENDANSLRIKTQQGEIEELKETSRLCNTQVCSAVLLREDTIDSQNRQIVMLKKENERNAKNTPSKDAHIGHLLEIICQLQNEAKLCLCSEESHETMKRLQHRVIEVKKQRDHVIKLREDREETIKELREQLAKKKHLGPCEMPPILCQGCMLLNEKEQRINDLKSKLTESKKDRPTSIIQSHSHASATLQGLIGAILKENEYEIGERDRSSKELKELL